MKQRILLLLFIAFTCNTHAQDSSTFRLKDYKYRTPGYKALQISMNTSGSIQSIKFPNIRNQTNNFELSPSSIQYYRITSTEKKQSTHNLSITPSYYSQKNIDNDVESRSRNLNAGLTWTLNNRYFTRGNKFFEWGNNLYNSFSQQKHRDPYNKRNYNYDYLRNSLFIGIGKGRIENVQDAQMALFIINDLEHHGLTTGLTDGQTLNDFAKLITDLNNRRIFDYRRRRIFELTQIENFLKERAILSETDIRHFTIINDNWTFAFNPLRRSGTSWYVRLQAGGRYDYNFDKTKNVNDYTVETRDYAIELGPQIGIEKYIPVNLKWQKNMGVSLTGWWINGGTRIESIYNGMVNRTRDSSRFLRTGLNVFYGIGFFPNTRTQVNAEFNLSSFNDWGDDTNPQRYLSALTPSILLKADYFLGYRTRLQAQLNLSYEKRYEKDLNMYDGHLFTGFFSLGLQHTIF